MKNNFDVLKGFNELRDFAICMSINNFCCHKDEVRNCFNVIPPSQMRDECRKCWLDFLTSDEGIK